MKIINKLIYTDKQYIEILEKKIKEHNRDYNLLIERHNKLFNEYKKLEEEIVERAHKEYKLNETIINFNSTLCEKQSIINDLRDRIYKAIEYIKEETYYNDKEGCCYELDYNKCEDLLKILKGEENE